jgi:hypothetical protein
MSVPLCPVCGHPITGHRSPEVLVCIRKLEQEAK